MWRICFGLLLAAMPVFANAELISEPLQWHVNGTAFKGVLAYDKTSVEQRPAVLVVPEWWGINDYVRSRAKQLAEMGYLALVVDMYGDGRSTTDAGLAAQWAKEASSDNRLRERTTAALAALKGHKLADAENIAAIGFCFGGNAVLELAYSGASLNGAVSFHGTLPALSSADAQGIQASILVLHGANDPFVKPEVFTAFMDGLRGSNADWQLVIYGGAVHAFSNPDADAAGLEGVAYDEQAAERAWHQMQEFFSEVLDEEN